jgi:C4-dicarboxylate transporter DctM subunit
MIRLWEFVKTVERYLSAILLGFSVVLMIYQVVMRYVFAAGALYWPEELITYFVVWTMFLGVATLLNRRDGLTTLLLIKMKLPHVYRETLSIATSVLGVLFSIYMGIAGFETVIWAFSTKITSNTPNMVPLYLPYLIIPIAGILWTVHWLILLFSSDLSVLIKKGKVSLVAWIVLAAIAAALGSGFVYSQSNPIAGLFIFFIILLVMAMPISFSLGIATTLVVTAADIVTSWSLVEKFFWSISSFSLLAIPFFILAAAIMSKADLTKHLLGVGRLLFDRFRSGMAMAVVSSSAIFGSMCGSSTAASSAFGITAIPEMEKKGFSRAFSAALIGASGTLAIIIPPSTILVLYGALAEVSVTELFIAGIVPGVLIAFVLMGFSWTKTPKSISIQEAERPNEKREGSLTTVQGIFLFALPIVILVPIYTGIMTPTETAAVSALYAWVISMFIFRSIRLRDWIYILAETVALSALIYAVVMFSGAYGFTLTSERLPQILLETAGTMIDQSWMFLLALNCLLLFLGCFIGPAGLLVMVVPIILPIAEKLGISLVHLGIVLTVNMELAFLTPPIGENLYVVARVAGLTFEEIAGSVGGLLLVLLGCLALITYIPSISLLLL